MVAKRYDDSLPRGKETVVAPDFGYSDCIDCGKYTKRRLMAHIPHICTDCLFPVLPIGNLVRSHHKIGANKVRSPG